MIPASIAKLQASISKDPGKHALWTMIEQRITFASARAAFGIELGPEHAKQTFETGLDQNLQSLGYTTDYREGHGMLITWH